MNARVTALLGLWVAGFCVACSDSSDAGAGGSGGSNEAGAGGGTEAQGLPCDVATVVEQHCSVCHGAPPASGAPQSLLTVADFKAPVPKNAEQSLGERSVELMAGGAMPPGSKLPDAEIQVISDWVQAGYPAGECQPITTPDPLLAHEPVCTSDDFWPAGQDFQPGKSRAEMFPGMPCIDCHDNPGKYGFNESPNDHFTIAGTIFPTGHEPDLCAGLDAAASSDIQIQIIDATGAAFSLTPNEAGNFFTETALVMPYSATVYTLDGIPRAMSYKPSTGDCNLCHTADGSNGGDPNSPVAPGRIVVPYAP